jgi:hypothetical protein
MTNQIFLVVSDANGNIIAVADPSKGPPGMSCSVASNQQKTVHEVQAPHDLMQRAHVEMKRIIKERIDAGASKPHLSRHLRSHVPKQGRTLE